MLPFIIINEHFRTDTYRLFFIGCWGEEMIIFQSIDWKHLDIDVFTIETDQHRQDILTFMKTQGYKWIQTISGDDVFWKIK